MKKIIVSFFMISNVVCSQHATITQKKLDSINLYRATADELNRFKEFLQENEKLLGWAYYYRSKGVSKYFVKEYDSVIYYGKKAIEVYKNSLIKRSVDEERLLLAYDYMGKVYSFKKKDYRKALVNYQKALQLCEKYSYKWISFTVAAIGDCHLELGDAKTAVKYYKRALKDSLYNTLPRSNIVLNTRLGFTYFEGLAKKDSARYYLKKALNRSHNSDYKDNINVIYSGLGELYESENEIDSTIHYYKLGKKAYHKYTPNYDYVYLFTLANESYVNIHEGQFQKAYDNLNVLRDTIENINVLNRNVKNLYSKVYDRFMLYYSETNNTKELLKVFKAKTKFDEAFHEKILEEKINDLEVQFQSKQKDKSITELEETTKTQDILIKQKDLITIVLMILLLLLFVLGALLFRQRTLRSKYEKLELEQRLLRSQMNPHFIFNALNVINSLIRKGSEKSSLYVSNLSNLLRLILNNSREEFIELEDEVNALRSYLTLRSDFNASFVYKVTVDELLNKDRMCIPPMLIQPFVENAIEHGIVKNEKGEIDVVIASIESKKIIRCTIEDNGIGYSKGKEKSSFLKNKYRSLSTHIVKERLDIYQKKLKVKLQFKIEDKLNQNNDIVGTKVIVSIPYLEN